MYTMFRYFSHHLTAIYEYNSLDIFPKMLVKSVFILHTRKRIE